MDPFKIAAISFRRSGKLFYYIYSDLPLDIGNIVVVDIDKGINLAFVVKVDVKNDNINKENLKKIIRVAEPNDLINHKKNEIDAKKAFILCKEVIVKSEIKMKLIKAEYSLDRQKLTFYYTADGRVDFRQLVKDLARIFKTRIEMRQIGVRDSTKILGGLAVCGRELCCATHLRKFDNISITVAKDQNLIFNPSKITGLCGRLICCLLFEKDIYEGIAEEEGKEYIKLVDEEVGGEL
jgi:cell fate regulator YaaT (PSP1 superfamily)